MFELQILIFFYKLNLKKNSLPWLQIHFSPEVVEWHDANEWQSAGTFKQFSSGVQTKPSPKYPGSQTHSYFDGSLKKTNLVKKN